MYIFPKQIFALGIIGLFVLVARVDAQTSADLQSLNAWSGLGLFVGAVFVLIAGAGVIGLMTVKKSREQHENSEVVHVPAGQAAPEQSVATFHVDQMVQPSQEQSPMVIPSPAPALNNASMPIQAIPQPSQSASIHPPIIAQQPPVIPPFTPSPPQEQTPGTTTTQIQS